MVMTLPLTEVTVPARVANLMEIFDAVVGDADEVVTTTRSPTTRADEVTALPPSKKVVVGAMVNVVEELFEPSTLTDVLVTAVTLPVRTTAFGAAMVMLAAIVNAERRRVMSTCSPTTRAAAVTGVEPLKNVVVGVMVNVEYVMRER
jgi:secreted trypsin-like serine protease